MRPVVLLVALVLLGGCSRPSSLPTATSTPLPLPTAAALSPTITPTAAPPPTAPATVNIAPTQTRTAELSQLATLTAPTATATAQPPTATPVASALDYSVAQQFLDFRNRKAGSPLLADVTGDTIPEAMFVSYPKGNCGRCTTGYVTVLSGKRIVFDSDEGYNLPDAAPVEGGNGFMVTEAIWQPGDYGNTPSSQRYLAYSYRPMSGDFALDSTIGPTITARWRNIPVPPELLRTGTERNYLTSSPTPSSLQRVCYELKMNIDTVAPERLAQWANETWPRDGINYVGSPSLLPGLTYWKRRGETRDISLFIPTQQNQKLAYINDCDDRR